MPPRDAVEQTSGSPTREQRYEQLTHRTEPVMLVLTLLFVGVAFLPEVVALSSDTEATVKMIEWALWFAFPIEFVAMFMRAPEKGQFIRERWWEVPIILITFPAIPRFLAWLAPARFVRLLRSTRAARMLRLTRFGGMLARWTASVRIVLTRHGLQYVLVGAVVLYGISTLLVFIVESGGDNPIQTYQEALWWGITAITTLPNDGNFPVTTAGKGIAVFVVFLGLTVVSLITANIAAFLVDDESPWDSGRIDAMTEQLERIEQKLNERA